MSNDNPIGLYFVRADDDNGENIDLLVEALNIVQAAVLWQEHFELDETAAPKWVVQLQLKGVPGAVDWGGGGLNKEAG